ncbi:hypothetical protein Agub_g11338, partial [Astrephomene gubernaculifera]
MNGHTDDMEQAGGQHAVQERLGARKLINRTEFVRLLEQALHRLGYPDVATLLEQQAGIPMQPPSASQFRCAVLGGRWGEALDLLPQLSGSEEVLREARFLILQQKYLECLEGGELAGALTVLRREMAPLGVAHAQLHQLAALLLCPSGGPPASRTSWLGGGAAHRGHLMQLLQSKLPPHLLLPEGRLEVLVEQALEAQLSRCPYHNSCEGRLSLLSDYQAGVECLPTNTVQVLTRHSDEVWHIAFSHNGKMLASGSKDRTAILWSVSLPPAPFSVLHVLGGHSQPVALVSWSTDDSAVITCSEETLRVWDVATGQLMHCFSHHHDCVTSCAWLPPCSPLLGTTTGAAAGGTGGGAAAGGTGAAAGGAAGGAGGAAGGAASGPQHQRRLFLSGGADRSLVVADGGSGRELQRWKRTYRVQDLALTPDGGLLALAASDRRVHLLRLGDMREAALPPESCPITSLALSPDGRHLLVALQTGEVHRWALGGAAQRFVPALDTGPDPLDSLPAEPAAVYRFGDGKPGRFVLRCGFGGSEGTFVVHGSEDCMVYLWHRDSGELLLKLPGHSATVNAVAWNPAYPFMMASAADDRTIRVWLA